MLKRATLVYLFLGGSVLPLIVNVLIYVLIIWKRRLQQVRFSIATNLTVAEFLTLFICSGIMIRGWYADNVLRKL